MIATGYKPHKLSKQFHGVAKISRETAQYPRVRMNFKVTSFLPEFNPFLPNLDKLIRNRPPLLYSDLRWQLLFHKNKLKQFTKEIRI